MELIRIIYGEFLLYGVGIGSFAIYTAHSDGTRKIKDNFLVDKQILFSYINTNNAQPRK